MLSDSAPMFPPRGRLAGIDYGTKRIGVAVCDPDRILASPFENYDRRTPALDADFFRKLVKEERIVGLVVGLPVHVSGQESQKSFEARQFAEWLKKETGLPVRLFDERYTSAQAEQHLLAAELTKKRRKARLDMLAAQILLAAYLESPDSGEGADALEDRRPRG